MSPARLYIYQPRPMMQHLQIAKKEGQITETRGFKNYFLITVHRAENVDTPEVPRNFMEAFSRVGGLKNIGKA